MTYCTMATVLPHNSAKGGTIRKVMGGWGGVGKNSCKGKCLQKSLCKEDDKEQTKTMQKETSYCGRYLTYKLCQSGY